MGNGKLSGLACIICAGNAVYATYFLHDKEIMVPRPFYIYAVVLALCGLHLMFRANPMLPKPANANEKKKSWALREGDQVRVSLLVGLAVSQVQLLVWPAWSLASLWPGP